MSDVPTIERNPEDGTLRIIFPPEGTITYEITKEALEFLVNDYNVIVRELEQERERANSNFDEAMYWRALAKVGGQW